MKGIIKKYNYICRVIQRKKETLVDVMEYPEYYYCRRKYLRYKAEKFYDELDDISYCLYEGVKLEMVRINDYEAIIKDADSVNVTVDGEFCKLAKVYKFPYNPTWVVYIAPLERLKE